MLPASGVAVETYWHEEVSVDLWYFGTGQLEDGCFSCSDWSRRRKVVSADEQEKQLLAADLKTLE